MPAPKPGAGEILVDVHAAAVNFMDCLLVSGKYQLRPQTPFVPGTDAAGIVAAVGEGVTRFKPGDRVACSNWTGAYSPQMVTSQLSAVQLPPSVDFVTGTTVRHGYGTAHYAFVERAKLAAGRNRLCLGRCGRRRTCSRRLGAKSRSAGHRRREFARQGRHRSRIRGGRSHRLRPRGFARTHQGRNRRQGRGRVLRRRWRRRVHDHDADSWLGVAGCCRSALRAATSRRSP